MGAKRFMGGFADALTGNRWDFDKRNRQMEHDYNTYHKGGVDPGQGERFAKLLGGETVIDVDSSGPAKDMFLAINQESTYEGKVDAIKKFAPYEAMAPETITIPNTGANITQEMGRMDRGKEVDLVPLFMDSDTDPYEILYKGS